MVGSIGSTGSKSAGFSRSLDKANDLVQNSTRRLSTGQKINKASDDAAGLAISSMLDAIEGELEMSSKNIDYGNALASVANGAMGEMTDSVIRMRELAEQTANGTMNDDQRALVAQEFNELKKGISQIAGTTEMNGINPFKSPESIKIHADNSTIETPNMNMDSFLAQLDGYDISTQAGSKAFLDSNMGEQISSIRAGLGAFESRSAHAQSAIESKAIAVSEANSRIRDADVADEVVKLTHGKILQQVNIALSAQVNNLNVANAQRLLG